MAASSGHQPSTPILTKDGHQRSNRHTDLHAASPFSVKNGQEPNDTKHNDDANPPLGWAASRSNGSAFPNRTLANRTCDEELIIEEVKSSS